MDMRIVMEREQKSGRMDGIYDGRKNDKTWDMIVDQD